MEETTLRVEDEKDRLYFWIGLGLAMSSSLFIGSSFIIKKVSLMRLNRRGSLRAGAGGFGYLKDWMWWLGFITMGVGELVNFTAYAFAPASLVTPLGALSVLVSTLLASKFLQESLTVIGKLGCVLCVIGSVIIIIHSPKEQEVKSVNELLEKFHDSGFVNYIMLVILLAVIVIFCVGPKYGNRHVLVYITLCSAIGSLTVMACKGLGLTIQEILSLSENENQDNYNLDRWLAFMFFSTLVVCITIQMNYLNKALDLFNTNLVTPVYYVIFTTLVIVASAILFREWERMKCWDIAGSLCGFFVVIVAIFLLQGFRDSKASYDERRREKQLLMLGASRIDFGTAPRNV